MRQLRFLRPGSDGDHVVLETADGAEQFLLYVTGPLRDAIRVDLPRLHPAEPQLDSTISPRDIQVRVRAGADPAELAEEGGVPLERVLRFARPVLEERRRITDEARRARARRNSGEGSAVVFGDAVDARFGTHGVDPTQVSWDAHRRPDGQWVVTASWQGGEITRRAEWVFNLAGRHVAPSDDAAAELLSDRPPRPLFPADEPTPEVPATFTAGVVAFPLREGMRDETTLLDGAAAVSDPDGPPGPGGIAELSDELFDQEALDDEPRHVRPVLAGAPLAAEQPEAPLLPLRLAELPVDHDADVRPSVVASMADDDEPDLEATHEQTTPLPRLKNLGRGQREDEAPATPPRPRSGSHRRPQVPTWDDIMLGTRRSFD